MKLHWVRVLFAAVLEVGWVVGLAHAHSIMTWIITIICIILSNFLLVRSAMFLPAGTVYSIFVGLGTAGAVIVDIAFFDEPFKWSKILLIGTLLFGVIGLQIITPSKEGESL